MTVVANERNVGHVEAFNNGWEQATGDLVVRLDADDLLPPGALARAAAVLEQHPEVGLVYGHPHHFDDGTTPVVASGPLTWTVWDGHAWLAERCRTGVACITSPEVVMRARVLRDVGPLDLALPFTPDMEQWMRLAAVSDVARVGGADQALHREHPASMSVTTRGPARSWTCGPGRTPTTGCSRTSATEWPAQPACTHWPVRPSRGMRCGTRRRRRTGGGRRTST